MFKFKLHLDRLLAISNFQQLVMYDCTNVENCSIQDIVKIRQFFLFTNVNTPYFDAIIETSETTYRDLRTGSTDILALSYSYNYIIFDAELPTNETQRQAVLDYIKNGVIEVMEYEDNVAMILYLQNSENDALNKTLTITGIMNGKFNQSIGFKNIDIDVVGYTYDFNYVHIVKLNRYYYVDSIELIASNITRLHLKEDVLMSWKALIILQSAFVTRYENSTDKTLVDIRLPLEDKMSNSSVVVTDTPSTSSLVNCTLKYDFTMGDINILVLSQSTPQSLADIGGGTHGWVEPPSGSGLPQISSKMNETEILSFTSYQFLSTLVKAYRSDDSVSSFIYSVLFLPFDADEVFYVNTQVHDKIYARDKFINSSGQYVPLDSTDTPLRAYRDVHGTCPYIVVKDFTYSIANPQFYDREPYTHYEIYVPFCGWIKIDSQKFFNKRILIYYTIDLNSGISTAYIYNYTDQYVIWSGNCQLGLKIDLTQTNNEENIRQKQNNELNMALGLVSSALSIGVGAVSGNPLAVAGGILSGGKAIASSVNSNNMIFDRAQITYGSSDGALYSNIDIKLRKSHHAPVSIDAPTYKHLQGLPYNKYVSSLSALTGYVEIGEIHFDPKGNAIYQDEISEIIELLQKGCIF